MDTGRTLEMELCLSIHALSFGRADTCWPIGSSTFFIRTLCVLAFYGGSRYTVDGVPLSELYAIDLSPQMLTFVKCIRVHLPTVLELILDDCSCSWHWSVWSDSWWVWPRGGPLGFLMSHADADVLMAFPELYRYGRERTWFSMKSFAIYMLDGVVQVLSIFPRVPLARWHPCSLFRYTLSLHTHTSPRLLVLMDTALRYMSIRLWGLFPPTGALLLT